MAGATDMKMVNSRVSTASAEAAARVLKRNGLTVSSFIRNSLEYVANRGEVPESGMQHRPAAFDAESLRNLIASLEAKPMPGREDYEGLGEDELVDRMRMERYGY